jgi:hypothetical protein
MADIQSEEIFKEALLLQLFPRLISDRNVPVLSPKLVYIKFCLHNFDFGVKVRFFEFSNFSFFIFHF